MSFNDLFYRLCNRSLAAIPAVQTRQQPYWLKYLLGFAVLLIFLLSPCMSNEVYFTSFFTFLFFSPCYSPPPTFSFWRPWPFLLIHNWCFFSFLFSFALRRFFFLYSTLNDFLVELFSSSICPSTLCCQYYYHFMTHFLFLFFNDSWSVYKYISA